MLELISKVARIDSGTPSDSVSLPWEKRLKSRLRVQTTNGREAGIFLPRGSVLRGGDLLASADGTIVAVAAASETVSTVHTSDPLLCARLCYHLGNRHVALEISVNYLRYLHDHVLDEMVNQLGGTVTVEEAPFEPEHGAYSGAHGGHHHGDHQHG